MRDILFRGKRKDNGEWVYGWYAPISVSDSHGPQMVIVTTESNNYMYMGYGGCRTSPKFYSVDPNTVGQFTGLTDYYGKKIFEGDIHGMRGWIVSYCADVNEGGGMNAGWYVQRDDWESWMPLENHSEHVIIGNIHDNPELMKEE